MTAARRLGSAMLLLLGIAVASRLIHLHIAGQHSPSAGFGALPDVTLEPAARTDGPGLLVTSLRTTGGAAPRALRVGDRIEAINGRAVASLRDLARTVDQDGNPVLTLHLRRGDQQIDVQIDRRVNGVGAHGA
ncbi:PDZ domain-containing protein [Sphingomonas flavalba]|uniref:PDZ domain-containing protein n=1 Tax=Sphingomonas flavalba TaxID=2559804 RepID=UPI0039DF8BE3